MTKDEMNAMFTPASECKKLACQYIAYRHEQTNYYANPYGGGAKTTVYKLAVCDKKMKDILVLKSASKSFFVGRESIMQCYVVSVELAAKWPRDEYQNELTLDKSELITMLETLKGL